MEASCEAVEKLAPFVKALACSWTRAGGRTPIRCCGKIPFEMLAHSGQQKERNIKRKGPSQGIVVQGRGTKGVTARELSAINVDSQVAVRNARTKTARSLISKDLSARPKT